MPFLQDIIHKLEVGGGARFFRVGLTVLALIFLTVGYNWRAFKNMACAEAMDGAQVARNISEGKGFSTLFIRPFSMYLVKRRNVDTGRFAAGKAADPCQIQDRHPDLANPPVYPLLLAGAMKVLPFRYPLPTKPKPFWSNNGSFWRYEPDFLIAVLNEVLFFTAVILTFLLARSLFDARVAWLSGGLLLGTELLWRFSVSGLSTMLLILIFLGLAWCLVLVEREVREPKHGPRWLFVLTGLGGIVLGLGGLTRYAFGWLIFPVLVFVILFGGRQRILLALLVLVTFLGTMAPWLVRNYNVSGTPFGTAGYAVMENTLLFPEHRLERSLEPDLSRLYLQPFWMKLMTNSRQIVQGELPKLGGTWVTALFLVGLLVGFRNPSVTRLRYFLLGSLALLVIVQALGRTQLSEDAPEINSENLLVLLAPLVLVYGVSLFFLLLDQIQFPLLPLRYVAIGVFSLLVCLPMIFVFLPPRGTPIAYPPYYPPVIQAIGGWLKPNELTMSDVPWAVAWYAQRQSVWLTRKCMPDPNDPRSHEHFFAINDDQKPINLLYLTPVTMDAHFFSQWFSAGEQSWGSFIINCLVLKKVDVHFPLSESKLDWLSQGQLVLADWRRWPRGQ